MKRLLLSFAFLLICGSAFALTFPPLSGRVVDAAHILSSDTIADLNTSLADLEQQTTNQFVIVTIPSLEGGTIEDYGYQLGRKWGIGQKDKDNGVILLIAPQEHRVRIEVGYGLEGTLTDAQSNQIIQNIIVPYFKAGQMETGINVGAGAIITVLGGKANSTTAPPPNSYDTSQTQSPIVVAIYIILLIAFFMLRLWILPWWFPLLFSVGHGGFGSGGGGGFSGGFSGGGGSFGGGGASGGW